jgi:hypothetical protein
MCHFQPISEVISFLLKFADPTANFIDITINKILQSLLRSYKLAKNTYKLLNLSKAIQKHIYKVMVISTIINETS